MNVKYVLGKWFFVLVFAALLGMTANVWAEAVLVEAESFDQPGGWKVDQQFVDQMGSPYLLAHGLGQPVEDAQTTVTFPATGLYKVWVRTKNWVPGEWEAPGRFQLKVNNSLLPTTFGTETGWGWQEGGVVQINSTDVELSLIDLTGFDGRCDAIYFDTNHFTVPVNDVPSQRSWRNQLRGFPAVPPAGGRFDVIIVGGGLAGCGAALAAEERGLDVALVQDRPVLGGNASSEIRVHTLGVYGQGQKILSKIDTEHYPNGDPAAIEDQEKRTENMMDADITFFMPYRAYDVETVDSKITSVDVFAVESGEALRLTADTFIDCTGDGWIGYWAGADYRYGRESKNEFSEGWDQYGELWSPETPDNRVMGVSLLWYSSQGSSVSTFPEVPWAMDVAKTQANTSGEWYWEYSNNNLNMMDDAEEIRDHMLRAIYGCFYNAKQSSSNDNRYLDWVGYVAGKRESRRLMGDYIYTLSDEVNGTKFDDAVVEETREVDVHYQRAETGSAYDFLSVALYKSTPRYYVPFRSLYSRNISNLMMAGRCFSCSHVGLGGPRVMRTCGQMGIAVGYAASLCEKYETNPRGVYTNHIEELKGLISGAVISSDWQEAMNDGFDAAGTFAGNGWSLTSGAKWTLSTSGYGNPDNYAWGGGGGATRENIVSGALTKNTGVTISQGMVLKLIFDIRRLHLVEFDSSIKATLYYMDESNKPVIMASEEFGEDLFPHVAWYASAGVVKAVPPEEAIGRPLYVAFEGGPHSWNGASAQRLGIDNVKVYTSEFVLLADINDDDEVDVKDLMYLTEDWLKAKPDDRVDLWPDEFVNLKDYSILSKYWGI